MVTAAADPAHLRVVIASDDLLIRDVLWAACQERELQVVGEAQTVDALLTGCLEAQPHVVVTAADLKGEPVDRAIPVLASWGSRVVILSDDHTPERLVSLLESGASGYLLHDASPGDIAEAVIGAADGMAPLHPAVAATILHQWRRQRAELGPGAMSEARSLTRRETEVLAAMADGMPTKAIARHLCVAVKTVENHKIRIFDKLGVRTQAQAVSVAIGHGLVAGSDS